MKDSQPAKRAVNDPAEAPEQSLADTPAPPWKRPRPDQKAAARPVKEALAEALSEVDTEAAAEAAVAQLASVAGETKAAEVAAAEPELLTVDAAAEAVQAAADGAAPGDKAARVGRWKWVESAKGSGLFDLTADVGEKEDLSGKHPEELAKVKARWTAWRKEMDEAEPRGPFQDY